MILSAIAKIDYLSIFFLKIDKFQVFFIVIQKLNTVFTVSLNTIIIIWVFFSYEKGRIKTFQYITVDKEGYI